MKHNYRSAPTVFRRLEGALDSACRSRFSKDDELGLKQEQRAFYLHLAMLWMKVLLFIANNGVTLKLIALSACPIFRVQKCLITWGRPGPTISFPR